MTQPDRSHTPDLEPSTVSCSYEHSVAPCNKCGWLPHPTVTALKQAALWVVLNWDAEHSQHGSMPALRVALGLPAQRPTREEAEARIEDYIKLGWADA